MIQPGRVIDQECRAPALVRRGRNPQQRLVAGASARTRSYAAFVFRRYSQRSEIGHAGQAGVRALHT